LLLVRWTHCRPKPPLAPLPPLPLSKPVAGRAACENARAKRIGGQHAHIAQADADANAAAINIFSLFRRPIYNKFFLNIYF
jgi:hypothetical protein